jgi:hypothetical protein
MIDTEEHHRPGCPGGGIKYRQETFGRRAQCTGCKAYWADGPRVDPAQTEHPTIIISRYRCRAHPHLPVNANGKGCPACQRDQQERETRTRGKRAERRDKATDRARVGS